MSFRCLVLLLVALPAVSGCASVPDDAGFPEVEALVSERMPQRVHWNRGGPEDEQVQDLVAALLEQELDVETAVQLALLHNATLQATFEELGIAQADLVQAGLLGNPVFDLELRFPARPRHPLEVHVVEDFMNVFTRPLRERVAAAEFDAVRLHVAGAVIDLAADVRAAYYDVQRAEQLVELHATVAAATDSAVDASARLREAGNITELDHENEIAMDGEARLALLAAEAERIERRERLSALMGLWGADTQWTVPGRLPDLPAEELVPEGIETLAIGQRLDLAAAAHEIEAAAAALGLTEATALIPSLEVGLHAEREPEGDTTVGPSIGFPLPLFDQGQARRARDESLLRRSQQRYLALAVEIRSEVRALRGHMLAARARAEYLRAVALPLRDRIVQQTQLQYNAMQIGVFELLAARRAEIETGRESVEALHDYWHARTALERAVGGSLARAAVAPPATGPAPESPPSDEAAIPDSAETPAAPHQHPGERP